MMAKRIALCVEEEVCKSPEIIGLEGEVLDSQTWLDVFTVGSAVRQDVPRRDDVEELWVISCEDVEPINLAASVKSDAPNLPVRLVTSDACGSLFSRAHTAQIDEVIESRAFPLRYAEAKRRMLEPLAGRVETAEVVEVTTVDEQPLETSEMRPLDSLAAVLVEEPVLLEKPQANPSTARFLQLQAHPSRVAAAVDGRAFVFTVVSGSGGAGKSAVSALGAVIAQKMGYKTLLLDCDLQFGDVAGMVGVKTPLCLDEALMHPDRLESELDCEGRLAVLAAPSRLEAAEEVVVRLPDLLERLAQTFEVIVVNTGASWAEQHAVLLERSSAALFLIDQRASSVRACRHALELCARCGIATGPFQFALNRCVKGAPLTSIDVSCALQGAPVFELKDGGRDVEDYLSGGAADELVEMRNEFAKSIEQVLSKLLPGGEQRSLDPAGAPEERRSLRRRGGSKRRGRKS